MPDCPKLSNYKTLNFKSKTFETIFYEELQDSVDGGLISSDENFMNYVENGDDIESNYVMQCSVHSKNLRKCYAELENIYDAMDIYKATGDDLDRIGELYGIPRPSANKSRAVLTFSLSDEMPYDLTIPQNSIVSTSTSDGVTYYTEEERTIIAGLTTIDIPAISTDTGTYSKVGENELDTILSDFKYNATKKLTVTNNKASTGGLDSPDEDEYRELILQWTTLLKRGTQSAYYDYFANLDGLNGVNIIPMWDGAGTLKVILDPTDDDFLTKVDNELDENVNMYDSDVYVTGATKTPIDINLYIDVTLDTDTEYTDTELEQMATTIQDLIKIYIEGGKICDDEYIDGLGIGQDFIPYQCGVFLYDELESIENIQFNYPDDLTDDELDNYGVIGDEEIATCGDILITIK